MALQQCDQSIPFSPMAALCIVCHSPAISGLAMLRPCNFVLHAKCARDYVGQHFQCPQCEVQANLTDVLDLHIEPPELPIAAGAFPTQKMAPIQLENAFALLRERFASFANNTQNEQEQIAVVQGACIEITGGGPGVSESGWDKLINLLKDNKLTVFAALIALGMLTFIYWPAVTGIAGEIGAGIMAFLRTSGLISFLGRYGAEALKAIITLGGTIGAFFGIKNKITSD